MFKETEQVVLIVAGCSSAFAVILSSLLIRRHLMYFSRPVVQVSYDDSRLPGYGLHNIHRTSCFVGRSTKLFLSNIKNDSNTGLAHTAT